MFYKIIKVIPFSSSFFAKSVLASKLLNDTINCLSINLKKNFIINLELKSSAADLEKFELDPPYTVKSHFLRQRPHHAESTRSKFKILKNELNLEREL